MLLTPRECDFKRDEVVASIRVVGDLIRQGSPCVGIMIHPGDGGLGAQRRLVLWAHESALRHNC